MLFALATIESHLVLLVQTVIVAPPLMTHNERPQDPIHLYVTPSHFHQL